jgi:hypothetical protein
MNESEIDKIVAGIAAELYPAGKGEREVVTREGPSEMGRTFAQGVTFGGADEAEAWLRSQFNGEDYEAALGDVQGKLSDYRQARPGEAFFTEMGGAALPSIVAAVATGGGSAASQFPLWARAAKILGIGSAGARLTGSIPAKAGFRTVLIAFLRAWLLALRARAWGQVSGRLAGLPCAP